MGVNQITPISDLRLRLFSAQFLFQLRTGLVALVQSFDHIIGDVVFRIGVKQIVAGFADDDVKLLGLVVFFQESLKRIPQLIVVFCLFVGITGLNIMQRQCRQ